MTMAGKKTLPALAAVRGRGRPSLRGARSPGALHRDPRGRRSRSIRGCRSQSDRSSFRFSSRYRPLWVASGIVAAELLLALADHQPLSATHSRTGFWRRAHYVNFAVWDCSDPTRRRQRDRPQRAVGALRSTRSRRRSVVSCAASRRLLRHRMARASAAARAWRAVAAAADRGCSWSSLGAGSRFASRRDRGTRRRSASR